MDRTTRRGVLAAAGAGFAGTAGCLGGGSERASTASDADLTFENFTNEERTFQLKITRPLSWTPSGTATRTGDGIPVVAEREVTVSPDGRQTVRGVYPEPGRFVVSVELAATNEPLFSDDTRASKRVDTRESGQPLAVESWYIEDSPELDDYPNAEQQTYFDVVIDGSQS